MEVPDSPPQLPPSKASPPMKRAKFQIPLSSPVGTLPSNVKTAASNYIPVKVSLQNIYLVNIMCIIFFIIYSRFPAMTLKYPK